jgi:hypothetical protein
LQRLVEAAGIHQPVGPVADDVHVVWIESQGTFDVQPGQIEPPPPQADIAHGLMAPGIVVVERQCAFRRGEGLVERFRQPIGQISGGQRDRPPGMGMDIGWIEVCRLRQEAFGLGYLIAVHQLPALQEIVVGRPVRGGLSPQLLGAGGGDASFHGRRHGARDLVLDRKDVLDVAIVPLGP